MAPARDGTGDDAAPVAPAERAGGSGLGGASAVISVPWALVAVLFVLTCFVYGLVLEPEARVMSFTYVAVLVLFFVPNAGIFGWELARTIAAQVTGGPPA